MLKGRVSSLLFAVFASLSVAAVAAESPKSQTSKPVASATQPAKEAAVEGKVNLNAADVETLQHELIGIGEVKAKAIVDYREANGPFASVDELLEVKGIGAATLEKNREKLSIN
ncbi:helix-hairpin-helix domain-containing protein [Pseudomonas cavernae]|uniref:Helix-hairpin-helix domain-containing protein n=1 Tax=Pseudomonas cavernae TaxID=2320867 RepID=A0A385Z7R3_9PSED|nr:ComEA family DNA-binding protein [Pseudomonas cavernae]AYC33552.1 helix-hairpin-helix domain-containing protein [Pseudomonas cavernae]